MCSLRKGPRSSTTRNKKGEREKEREKEREGERGEGERGREEKGRSASTSDCLAIRFV